MGHGHAQRSYPATSTRYLPPANLPTSRNQFRPRRCPIPSFRKSFMPPLRRKLFCSTASPPTPRFPKHSSCMRTILTVPFLFITLRKRTTTSLRVAGSVLRTSRDPGHLPRSICHPILQTFLCPTRQARSLASVLGTSQAKDAVLIAQIPTTMVLNPTTAAAQANVIYTGPPQFAPITGTSLQYATNTTDKVIQVGNAYYLCLQGVWFMSATPQGPWTTAGSIPEVIYTIPPSSPVYNVTYVTQVTNPSGYVESSYTAGYLGAFVMGAAVGAIVTSGTGYYYPPYIGYPVAGYPIYHPYPTPYGAYGAYGSASYYHTGTGAYGVSQTAYGAYGSATRSASYNPYTGTAARSASVSTPYGKQSVGHAYNPYTGTYGATHQGSSPTAQWGQSYVSNGSHSATTQHYTTSQGTAASAQTAAGGKAAGTSTAYGNSAAAKTSSGDMYAGHDGNVYKNTGSGWQKSDGGGNWSNVNTQQNQQKAEQSAQNYSHNTSQDRSSGGASSENLDSEKQNRDSGSMQARNFGGGSHSGGGFGGGGRSFGGGRR